MHIVLNSFGASLRMEDQLFAVSTAEGKQLINPGTVDSITISRAARISSDAVLLAIQHEIDILFVDAKGDPQGRVWSIQYGSISEIRRKQIDFLYSAKAVDWVKELILEKLNNMAAMLTAITMDADPVLGRKIKNAVNGIEDHKNKIRALSAELVSEIAPTLRGWEGAASRKYFRGINEIIPLSYQFEKRSLHPARDPFNALLNYGYGILYGKVEGALIKAGIDPYVGVFHKDGYNRPALAYDVIEKFRVWIDYVVIQLCRSDAFHEECFISDESDPKGGVWLGPLGKRILIQSVNDYLAEIVKIEGLSRSRENQIQQYAYSLANIFTKS